MFFGLSFEKLLVIAGIAAVVIGPAKLPSAAARLAEIVRSLRSILDGATERAKAELGDEVGDIDWKRLDPRQYDPRQIIRAALTEAPSEDLDAVDWSSTIHPETVDEAPSAPGGVES